jgi:hypothetical protein
VATSTYNLGELYEVLGRYVETEPLLKRSLEIRENALNPDDPQLEKSLNCYATLMRKTGRDSEAAKLESRVQTIRVKRKASN